MAITVDSPGRFRPPPLIAHELLRERLLTRTVGQQSLGAAQLTLVLGPAGFGKTTLLAQAYRRARSQAAAAVWLECSDLDAVPAHFLDSLYAAGAAAGMGTEDPDFTTSDFAARIATLGPSVYVFFDAFERLVASGTERLVERLTGLLPESVRVVIGSRRQPNAWFLQRELQGLASTLDAAELRLTHAELTALLPERFGADEIARIERLTEGWPVAAQMTRLRAGGAASITDALERLTHEGLGLFEYLAEEVLQGLSPEHREFLRDTSILPTINAAAANAVLCADNGFAMMTAALRLQPIVTITSDREFTIRLHPLLRQYMRNELAHQGHDHERELQRRAAEARIRGGQVIEGIQHALHAEDLRLAVRLFERAGGEALVFRIGPPRVQSLLSALPASAREHSLALKLVDLLMTAVEGRARVVRELKDAFQLDLAAAGEPDPIWQDYATGLSDAVVALFADLHEGAELNASVRCAITEQLARLRFANDEAKLGLITALEVLLYARHAGVADARRALSEYVAVCERNEFAPQLPSVNPQRGLLAFLAGDMDAALRYLDRRPDRSTDHFNEPEPLLAQLSAVLVATIHYERSELERAHQILDGLIVDPDRTFPETWALSARLRAVCLDALGRRPEADHVLAEESLRARRRAATRLGLIIEAAQLELAVRRGATGPGSVERLAEALAQELERADASWLLTSSLARGTVLGLIASGHATRARQLSRQLVRRSDACGHGPFSATGHLLAARAAEALGDAPVATAEVTAALTLTAPGRLVRPYVDILGHSPAALLRALGQHSSPDSVDHLRGVLRACDAFAVSWGGARLSEREQDVLWALSVHASTKAIARHLGVSPETVKHHLKGIFAKLGVHSRDEALRRLAHLS